MGYLMESRQKPKTAPQQPRPERPSRFRIATLEKRIAPGINRTGTD
jgi:hypothetical protein